ncbi:MULTISPECIES: ABC transporter permease [Haloarcula]|uniref:ABC transporter permease n=1 Tax=Haloarcula TaxID=2237 RepID=UPI0023EC93CC|nr:ABC transporter permease [Halomicroarcula sp. XH51]
MSSGRTGFGTASEILTGREMSARDFVGDYFPWMLVVAIYLVAGVFYRDLFAVDTLESVIVQSTTVIILAIGMAFTLVVAEIDLSIVSALLFAPLMGLFAVQAGAPMVVGLLVTALVGLLIGAWNGIVITKVGVPSLIQTLASWWILQGAVLSLTQGRSIADFPDLYYQVGSGSVGPFRNILFVTLAVVLIAWYYSTHVVSGRRLFLVGGDPDAAQRMGIDVSKYKMHAFLISGLFAAIGGFVLITRVGVLSSGTGTNLLMPAIAAPVIAGISLFGGTGKIINVPAGALLVQVILTITRVAGVSGYEFQLAQGILVFVAVVLMELKRRDKLFGGWT